MASAALDGKALSGPMKRMIRLIEMLGGTEIDCTGILILFQFIPQGISHPLWVAGSKVGATVETQDFVN